MVADQVKVGPVTIPTSEGQRDRSNARFHQSPCHQQLIVTRRGAIVLVLVGLAVTISLADLGVLFAEIERVNQLAGRVGDTPTVGAGTWADNRTCAVSATGKGDAFVRTAFARRVADLIELSSLSPEAAANSALEVDGVEVTPLLGACCHCKKKGEGSEKPPPTKFLP